MTVQYSEYAASGHRRRRWPWVLVGLVVLLAVLFVVADRVILKLAENRAATALQQSQGLASTPSVSFAGFPFLTQLATGRFPSVSVTAHGIDVGSQATLHVASVTVHLHDVTATDSYHTFHAARADADATVGYADLSKTVGVPVSYAGNGRLSTRGTVSVGGRHVTGTVTARVVASSQRGLRFVHPVVRSGSQQLSGAAANALARPLERSVSLAGLPFDVQVRGVDATSSGVVLHLSGQDISYSRS